MSKNKNKPKPKIEPEPVTMGITVTTGISPMKILQRVHEVRQWFAQNEAGLKNLETALKDLAYADIVKAMNCDLVLPAFILCSCFIEQVATFRYGCTNIGKDEFVNFVKEYLPGYVPEQLREDLRNKLVHNFSLGETYTLISRNPHAHLELTKSKSEGINKILINLENFVAELGTALGTFLNQMKNDPVVKGNALHALNEIHVIGKGDFEINHAEGTYFDFPDKDVK